MNCPQQPAVSRWYSSHAALAPGISDGSGSEVRWRVCASSSSHLAVLYFGTCSAVASGSAVPSGGLAGQGRAQAMSETGPASKQQPLTRLIAPVELCSATLLECSSSESQSQPDRVLSLAPFIADFRVCCCRTLNHVVAVAVRHIDSSSIRNSTQFACSTVISYKFKNSCVLEFVRAQCLSGA